MNYSRPGHESSQAILTHTSFPVESCRRAHQASIMQGLNHRYSFPLAGVVGGGRDQWKRVVEMSQIGPFAPQERPQSHHVVPGPKRSHRRPGLHPCSVFSYLVVVRRIFQDFMTGRPQQFALPDKNFVFPARLTVVVVRKKYLHGASDFFSAPIITSKRLRDRSDCAARIEERS